MTAPGPRWRRSLIGSLIAITLIWGSTWLVIRGQLGAVAPQWSVTYRFLIAAGVMFAVARAQRLPLGLGAGGWKIAAALGLFQFCVNFNLVYIAERHVTSGLVAALFGLLLIPNSLLAWAFLGQRPSGRFFAASAVALAGIALLFLEEYRSAPAAFGNVGLGIGLTLGAILGASCASVLQAHDRAAHIPLPVLLAWSMLAGVAIDAAIALAIAGPPTFDASPAYVGGLLYLALFASALAFSLYFPVVRELGPGRAAYLSVIVPVVAMTLSTLFEGYRWTLVGALGGLLAIGGMVGALSSRRPIVPAAPAD